MSKEEVPTSRPGQQPGSGVGGSNVQSQKKVQATPEEEAVQLREMITAMQARLDKIAVTPVESGELEMIRSTMADLVSRMGKMESFGGRTASDKFRDYAGDIVKIKVLAPIRLPRDFRLQKGLSRTPTVGSVIEVPEELAVEFEQTFEGSYGFAGERFQPEPGAVSQITRHKIQRAVRVKDGEKLPDPIPQPRYAGRAEKTA